MPQFFILIIFSSFIFLQSLHGMEKDVIATSHKKYSRRQTTDTTSTKPKDNSKLSIFSSSDGLLNSLQKISPRSKTDNNTLIEAVRDYNVSTTQLFIDNPNTNLNQQDKYGNTALHRGVIQLIDLINNKNKLLQIITLFLHDPRTDTSITRSCDNRTASQILSGGTCPEVRALLFARITLDTQTNHDIGKMLFESYINNITIDDNLIKQTVQSIKDKIRGIETVQKNNSEDLPEEAKLPDYATDDFIFTMIKNRIPVESDTISESQKTALKNIFFKEIETSSYNLSIDIHENAIGESIENILKTINQSCNHLMRFTTEPCIFELLEIYVNKQKSKTITPKPYWTYEAICQ